MRKSRAVLLSFPGESLTRTYQAAGGDGGRVSIDVEFEPAAPGEEAIPPGMVVKRVRVRPASGRGAAADRG